MTVLRYIYKALCVALAFALFIYLGYLLLPVYLCYHEYPRTPTWEEFMAMLREVGFDRHLARIGEKIYDLALVSKTFLRKAIGTMRDQHP